MGANKEGEAATKRASTTAHAEPAKKRKRYEEKPVRASRRDERREVMARAKATWEQLRPKATSKEKSVSLVDDLLKLLSGRIAEFVFRHDGSRIVQWMLNDGNESQKRRVMDELLEGSKKPTMEGEDPFFVKLACDRYGRHLAAKMLRVADKKHKALIFESYLKGNVTKLIRNVHGADMLDSAYQTVVNNRAKQEIVLELLYGREKKLLDTVRGKIFSDDQPKAADQRPANQSILEYSLQLVGDTFKDVAVEGAAMVLNQMVDKETLLRFELVHAAFKEYLYVVMTFYPKEKSIEIATQLAPMLIHFAHTKPGIFVAVNCVKLLDAKHRKKVVRGMKTHIRKLLEDEYGHRLILALFEWVDDTRLVGNTVSAEIFSGSKMAAEVADMKDGGQEGKKKGSKKGPAKNEKKSEGIDMGYLKTVCGHKYARMPLLSLFFGQDTRYFNPDVYKLIWSNLDEKFDKTSKKDGETRRSELRLVFEGGLRDLMRSEVFELLQSHWSAPIVLGAVVHAETQDAVAQGLGEVLKEEEQVEKLAKDTCARKTLATMFKIGNAEFASAVLKGCGIEVVSKLASFDRCMPIVHNLATINSEAKKALGRVAKAG